MTCRKILYRHKRDAERALASIRRREGDRGIHIYRCPDCSKWHLGHGLPPPADFDALTASGNRYSLKEEAERRTESDRLDALAAQREQRRTRKGERR